MISMDAHEIEQFWDRVLSRDAAEIRAACVDLSPEELARLLDHLTEMVHGEGWHLEQRISARAALDALASGTAGRSSS